jgi:hypothetical protein
VRHFQLRGTSLLLVCAFAGKELAMEAYRHAVEDGIYSYGDCVLIVCWAGGRSVETNVDTAGLEARATMGRYSTGSADLAPREFHYEEA